MPEWTPEELKRRIRTVPDFPVPGIRFRDITTLLKDGPAFRAAVDLMWEQVADLDFRKVLAIEARGYIFGSIIAYRKGVGLIIVRKKGKLPAETITTTYSLEYGSATLEVHQDGIAPGEPVLIVDDLLATGGTALAAAELVQAAWGQVAGFLFLIELDDLQGRRRLQVAPVFSIIHFREDE
ncbi:Adenine phosphoribosyltransferase [bacterium HR11]|nr:Adenine phosphoribosyltransferase [bacterium HR11]